LGSLSEQSERTRVSYGEPLSNKRTNSKEYHTRENKQHRVTNRQHKRRVTKEPLSEAKRLRPMFI
jgi:hypothetical protein